MRKPAWYLLACSALAVAVTWMMATGLQLRPLNAYAAAGVHENAGRNQTDGAGAQLNATPAPYAVTLPAQAPPARAVPDAASTPAVEAILAGAADAVTRGNDKAAISAYRDLLARDVSEAQRAEVLLALATAQLRSNQAAEASETLTQLRELPDGAGDPAALFLLAQAQLAAGAYDAAVFNYWSYLNSHSVGRAYAWAGLGDAYAQLGRYDDARLCYTQANMAGLPPAAQAGQAEHLAAARAAAGAVNEAVAAYDDLMGQATTESERGRLQFVAANILLAAGRAGEAYARMRDIVYNAPGAVAAPEALRVLLAAHEDVGPQVQGLVAFRAREYERALSLFRQSLAQGGPQNNHYFMALALQRLGRNEAAVKEFDAALASHESQDVWDSARIERAWLLETLGRVEDAVYVFDDLSWSDASYRWDAADLMLSAGRYNDALARYLDLARIQRYATPRAEALMRAGVAAYLAGDHTRADSLWNSILRSYPYTTRRPRLLLLLGKNALGAGNRSDAQRYLAQVEAGYPGSYYSLRAQDLLDQGAGAGAFVSIPAMLDVTPAKDAEERAETEQWLARWLGLSSSDGIGALSAGLRANPLMIEGHTLWRMGLLAAAKANFEQLRRDYADDPLSLYQLSLFYRDLGLYRSSIIAAQRVIELSPAGSPLAAPRFLARLVYPAYYTDMVEAEAQGYDLDPLLVLALIRQESLFEGFITSYASAAGLMQVMPATGAYVAARLGWRDFETAALYQAGPSVRLGSWYLAEQYERFDGSVYAALAAYNAGPSRSARWYARSGGDPDVFLSMVDIEQPQDYIAAIYVNYSVYQALYTK